MLSASVSKEGKCSDGHSLGDGPRDLANENPKGNLKFLCKIATGRKIEITFVINWYRDENNSANSSKFGKKYNIYLCLYNSGNNIMTIMADHNSSCSPQAPGGSVGVPGYQACTWYTEEM